MGQQQSKGELLYQQVNYGNTEGIKSLKNEGAELEWKDSEGKTPLIVACMNPELYNVAQTLIDLGANLNAYRPGRHAGTPLHHAAKRGLDQTVRLLLLRGANPLVMNDDCQTPLDIARDKGFSNVVRAIEGNVGLFNGWLRELYGPGFLELLAPQLLSRKVWVVVVPCGSVNSRKTIRLELAIYNGLTDAKPRTVVPLWKANLTEPSFNQPDPVAIIADISRIPRRWKKKRAIKSSQEARHSRIKLAPLDENEKPRLKRFCDACKGIPQSMQAAFPLNIQPPTAPLTPTALSTVEDEHMAMAINASLQSAVSDDDSYSTSSTDSSYNSSNHKANEASTSHIAASSAGPPAQHFQAQNTVPSVIQIEDPSITPSAPLAEDGPIHYPSIDISPVDLSSTNLEAIHISEDQKNELGADSSCCTICLDAPLEGACIPCGHMAGCMMCLNEIKSKKMGCPVCRSNIDQVIRIYAV